MNIIKTLNFYWNIFLSKVRLFPFQILGLHTGKGILINSEVTFPWLQLKNIFLGNNVSIGRRIWFYIKVGSNAKIIIKDGTHLGQNMTIAANSGIEIGKNCVLSYNVSIIDHEHSFDRNSVPTNGEITDGKKIIIEDECFVGCNSTILKGVHLGTHCIVGANTVVTKSFPNYSIIVGNAGKQIGTL